MFNLTNGMCVSVNTRQHDNVIFSSPEEACFTWRTGLGAAAPALGFGLGF